jgi:hypothetical protein
MQPALVLTSTHTQGPTLLKPAGMTPAARENEQQPQQQQQQQIICKHVVLSSETAAGQTQ